MKWDKILDVWEKIPGLVRLLLIYALLNGVIYAGQEIYHYSGTQKMNKLDSDMSYIDREITTLESYATDEGLSEPYYSQYKNDIDEYNQKADEYNKLNEKTGRRWWLIPIPIGRGSKTVK